MSERIDHSPFSGIPPLPAEAPYVAGLVNELPGKEVKAVLQFPEDREPSDVASELSAEFDGIHIAPIVNLVDRYQHPDQNFSIVRRPDGLHIAKYKKDKYIQDDITEAEERKVVVPGEITVFEAGILPESTTEQPVFLGTLRREKQVVLVPDTRVYQIVADTTTLADDPNGTSLRQLAIDYKGTQPGQVSEDTNSAREAIRDDLTRMRSGVIDHFAQQGIRIKSTKQSKRRWMKSQLQSRS